jgi:hypothetical protein
LDPKWAGGRPRRISDDDVAFIVETATTRLEKLGCPFTRWSVRKLARYLGDNRIRLVSISRERLRQVLDAHGITPSARCGSSCSTTRPPQPQRADPAPPRLPALAQRAPPRPRGTRPRAQAPGRAACRTAASLGPVAGPSGLRACVPGIAATLDHARILSRTKTAHATTASGRGPFPAPRVSDGLLAGRLQNRAARKLKWSRH